MKSGIMDKGRRVLAWTQASVLTVLFTNLAWIPYAQAAPTGGTVVGGSGSISQSGANTTINQTSQNMAIDWSSYNVNTDERVQYIQPNRSSISLNRILSNTASEIRGRIDANGQVILVNPHGMVFTDTAVINVGGIVASALDIQPSAFMNGDFIFNDIPGTEGKVVNSGIINASVGGNVTLLGKQVQNDGLIMAKLGSVNLAAGKEAVLTFDNEGLVGVKITKEILQEEIGIDPAVINNGKINAEGGRVLLTASVSQDVFSQAVNSNGLNQATSVVVHPDGTFTLGGGADVINSGTIDVSKTTDTANDPNVARIVLIGENVTSSGKIRADNINGNGGEIELHANNTTLLTGESLVSARSDTNGQGGIVKVLGNHVGLFDQSVVDVSGDLGGGQALIGGDYQGNNPLMRNANRTIIAPGANVYANALTNGDGGKVILWADDYTLFYGNLFARGGSGSGNGGFAEVSGKNYLEFHGDVDLTALMGSNGVLLLDPKNITISSGPTSGGTFPAPNQFDQFSDLASTSTNLNSVALSNQLNSSSVRLQANTDISIEANITGSNSLELYAGRSISIANNVQINLGLRNNEQFYAEINATGANAANRDAGLATFTMGAGSSINIISDVNDDPSGNIVITTGNFTGNNIGDITLQTLNTSSPGGDNSGDITVTNSVGDIVSNSQILAEGNSTSVNGERGGNITLTATLGNISINSGATISAIGGSGEGAQDGEVGDNGGNITLTAGNDITINATLASDGGHGGDFGTGGSGDFAGAITINAGNDLNINSAITADGGDGRGTGNRNAGNAGTINLTAGNNLTVTATVSAKGGNAVNNGDAGDAGNVTLTAGNDITISQNISSYRGLLPGTGVIGADATITLNGDAGDNIFNINDGAQLYATTVTLNGLGGNDTLVAGGATGSTNIWTINGLNGGILDNSNGVNFTTPDNENLTGDINFSNIESLTGGLQQDTFDLTAGNIQGLIDGGAGATDSLTITPNSRTVRLGNVAIADAVLDPFLNVNNVETITAGGGTNTIISAADQGYTWTVDSNTTGIVKPTTVFTAENTVTFGNFTVLTGGDNIDTFNISADKTWTINGGVGADIFNISSNYTGNISGGADNDTFNITALGLNSMTLFGDTGDDTLVAANEGNDWSIVDFDGGGGSVADGINDGTLNGGIEFVDIENLTGNEAVDTFTIQAGADIDGLIDGGTHTTDVNVVDTLTITDAGKTVELGIRTTYDPARISVHNVETITASGTGNTIIGAEQNNFWTVDGVSARVAGTETSPPADTVVTFANFDAIQGGSLSDQFDLSVDFGGTITGAAGTDTFNLTASQTGSMSGGDDSDTFNINAENITLTINGGTAGTTDVDTVVGADSTSINTWSFNSYTTADGSNGTLTNSGGTVTFNNIETATGGTGADQFTVTATGGIDTLSGGSASGDELVVNSLAADTINWTISSDNAGSVATNKVGSFTQIQTLTGGDGVDNFDISGAMTTISGSGNADDFNINVATTATINGNGGNDTFDIFANVNAGGSLNGGDENDT
ncbi:MAG: filamentous hemagglutinin N-terminal domain-containing protein, partial [Gammaproteobacteria bacterium]|nr:filamentous hemagglutinin N-terminal domain-containing protein [Gammaproteobacteria bacterium]